MITVCSNFNLQGLHGCIWFDFRKFPPSDGGRFFFESTTQNPPDHRCRWILTSQFFAFSWHATQGLRCRQGSGNGWGLVRLMEGTSQTATWYVQNLENNGINYQPQLVSAINSIIASISYLVYLPTLSMLTSQNWRHFEDPTPASYRFRAPSIGGSNDP